ncbi:hypothetical protein GCM10011247_22130 [Pseudomonas plecoglossicida]|uniref:Uncharacterized protein n=2 Tax=Pseudomonas plecoglossicida TaxID=70775 RepID=A0AAD0QYY3_PSEDL|nr:hypothetical protein DVB73_14005 [Pseudomonas plecoglossicida]EPB93540.1 hypothetical protein L321_22257 [Pseudomonas plecoglossicida NB2011]GLR36816.1 hypothetical protein GCM10011247_22130 [Pseudomonas plecoglossicida]
MKAEAKQALLDFLEQEINSAAQNIINLKHRQDHYAYGQLQVFIAFRRILSDTVTDDLVESSSTRCDLDRGFLTAVEKTLFQLGLIEQATLNRLFESQLSHKHKRTAASPHVAVDYIQKYTFADGKKELILTSDLDRLAQLPTREDTSEPEPQPVKAQVRDFLDTQINVAAQKIIDTRRLDYDDYSNGELGYLLNLRRWMEGTSNPQDLGLHGAVTDVLQQAGAIAQCKSYLDGLLQHEPENKD